MTIKIHHLHVSQSERLPWAAEELNLPYELITYTRAPFLSPPELKALHPSGTAPIIEDTSATPPVKLGESGACIEYLAHRYGSGKLFVPPSAANYADFLYWWHWANATLQPAMLRAFTVRSLGAEERGRKNAEERLERNLGLMDERLKEAEWLAGEEFTAADIMAVFSVGTMRMFYPIDVSGYSGIVGWLGRVGEREAFRRAMQKCDPGMEVLLDGKPPGKPFM